VTVECGFSGDAATKAATRGATGGQRSGDFEPWVGAPSDEQGAEANAGGLGHQPDRQPFTRRRIDVNSPYTKHLDTVDHSTHSTALTVPTYAAAPMQAPAPVVVQSGGGDGGSKAALALIAIVVATIAAVAGFAVAKGQGISRNEFERFQALAGREGEIKGRDAGWNQGRKQGRTEMEFLAQYEKLRTQAAAFGQGYRQGRSIGNQMGRDATRYRYGYGRGYGYGGYGRGYRGYGYGYGGRVGGAIGNAQALANATGSPVDVIVG
jgi:hypothetical protein